MGAAAIAARLPARPAERSTARAATLAFDRPGGPLVVICGLVPGAGTSTLAFALAEQAARESVAPVLLSEADPTAGGLAVLAGGTSPHSLSELALRVSEGDAPPAPFATLPSGLRLIAAAPSRRALPRAAALPVLHDARAAHGLVVVDCGTVARPEALPALELATHILWTLPATPIGLGRARLALRALAPKPGQAVETLVACAVGARAGVNWRELRELAEPRCERLVLVPHAPALLERADADPAGELAPTLADLATILRRRA